jgi:threonine synthase
LIQLQIFGAHIILVKGNYDVAFDLCRDVSEKKNWYNRSTAINPFNLEGKKTAAYEICEQLDFNIPDYVFIPVGDGCIISGIWKGFRDFYKIGFIDRLPRLIACQAQGSAAIHSAFKNKWSEPRPVVANTIADSISVDLPRDGVKALRALRDSNGDSILITDDEILCSQEKLAEDFGIFCEPSAAAAFAGLVKYKRDDLFKVSDSALALLTGNGLKDLASAEKTVATKKKIILDPEKDDPEEKLSSI